jgi:ribose transport system substrate-binding protein
MTKRVLMTGCASLALLGAILSSAASATDPDAALAAMKTQVFSLGPNGEKAAPSASVSLTPAELEQVKAKHAKAALVFHYSGNDWSNAQEAALKAQFAAEGIELVAVTDAGFKPEKAGGGHRDRDGEEAGHHRLHPRRRGRHRRRLQGGRRQGRQIGVHGQYSQRVRRRQGLRQFGLRRQLWQWSRGRASDGEALGGKGDIGLVFHAADFFVTRQRYDGFKKTIAEDYPDIHILGEQGIGGPDFSGDAEKAAGALLTEHPNLKAIWAVWDVPAEGVMSAARAAGRDDLIVVNEDLGENVAIAMAKREFIKGIASQRPYDQGVTEAILAGYALIGKTAPAYVALPAAPITRDTLLGSWREIYHQPPTAKIVKSMK